MKINSDYLKALQQVTELKKQDASNKNSVAAGFEDQLMQALAGQGTENILSPETLTAKDLGSVDLSLSGLVVENSVNTENGSELMDEFARLLDSFDAYAEKIGSQGQVDLKSAYAALEEISNGLSGLKERASEQEQRMPGFQAMLNELEVMATTERFKLNRGDYL